MDRERKAVLGADILEGDGVQDDNLSASVGKRLGCVNQAKGEGGTGSEEDACRKYSHIHKTGANVACCLSAVTPEIPHYQL